MDCSILAMTMVASLFKETVVFPTSLLASQVIGVTTQQNPVVFWEFLGISSDLDLDDIWLVVSTYPSEK